MKGLTLQARLTLFVVPTLIIALTGDRAGAQDTTTTRDSLDARRSAAHALEGVRVVERRAQRGSYATSSTRTATKTATPLRDVPQSVTVVTQALVKDQAMQGMADVVRYVPGVTMGQGEGNRDQPTIRGNATTADFFVDGVRDDVQYFRDLYNLDRVEVLKGSNAMIFGRGGGGGVINRVTREPQWAPLHALTLQGGSFDQKRISADFNQPLTQAIAARVDGVYENSGLYRNGVTLERSGINPTLTIAPIASSGAQPTRITFGYERFADHRTADRGVPSFAGRPIGTDVATFFGDPDVSYADVRVNGATATVSHNADNGLAIRNHTRFTSYDKIYQNVFPGAVDAAGELVNLSAYSNATQRRNLFNQTDVTFPLYTGGMRHLLLVGTEVGRQVTDNFRNTGFFNDTARTVTAPVSAPTISVPVTFRQSSTDADNHVTGSVGALYVQDQVALSEQWQLVAGARLESFDIRYLNHRNGERLQRDDRMLSPRAGIIYKPAELLSFYGSWSVSHLPGSGDQFSSLTDVTRGLEPEEFTNNEVGAKWDVADRLALTAAAYRLDRTNTRAPDPSDPTRTVQTGSQRTSGFELGLTGSVTPRWQVAGGYANQDARIASTTSAASEGAKVPLVPRTTVSLWNKLQLAPAWGVGLGVIHRGDMYAAIDNTVTLPGYTTADGALYVTLRQGVRAQVNVENLFNTRYFATSNGNNNIAPGAPRSLRVTVTTDLQAVQR